jgi:hypothetical protein
VASSVVQSLDLSGVTPGCMNIARCRGWLAIPFVNSTGFTKVVHIKGESSRMTSYGTHCGVTLRRPTRLHFVTPGPDEIVEYSEIVVITTHCQQCGQDVWFWQGKKYQSTDCKIQLSRPFSIKPRHIPDWQRRIKESSAEGTSCFKIHVSEHTTLMARDPAEVSRQILLRYGGPKNPKKFFLKSRFATKAALAS